MSYQRKIIIFLALLIMLTPLGLLTKNPAWGEWDEKAFSDMIGFVPNGIKNGSFFDAPVGDYFFAPLGEVGSYVFSALLGVISVMLFFYVLKKVAGVK